MIERKLWNGTAIPALGLGGWAIGGPFYAGSTPLGWGEVDDRESITAIRRGLDLGVRLFDTANAYGGGRSEDVLGQAIGRRDDVVIVTKFGANVDPATKQIGPGDARPETVRAAVEASLRRLRRDRIDIYLLHLNSHPVEDAAIAFDTLDRLLADGKIAAYGWSTDYPDRAAAFASREGFVAIEHAMNVFFRAESLMPIIEANGLISLNRSPLAMGLLTGKFGRDAATPADDIRANNMPWLDYFKDGKVAPAYADRLEAVRELLRIGGRTLAQGAIGWLWARSPQTIPIPGFRTVAQVEENAGALEKGPLPPETMAEIERVVVREPEGEPRDR